MKKRRRQIGEHHKASFEQYGFCTLPGCRCHDRKPASYHRIDKIVPASVPLTDLEIKAEKRRMARIRKIRERGYNLQAGWR